ncbi:MAG: hypothetical protein JRH11_16165 [Deltaproteobacteria bacterium]|nr:hypothetical protein [Deltaproteobacteria bacterium]
MKRILLLLILGLTSSCSSCDDAADRGCEERVALFVERMTRVAEVSMSLGPTDMKLPVLDAGQVITRDGSVLDTDGTRYVLNGRALPLEQVCADHETHRRNVVILHPGRDDLLLYIRAGRDTPADALAPILDEMAELDETFLVVVGPTAPSPIPFEGTPNDIRQEVERVQAIDDGVERATAIGDMFSDSITLCAPATTAFGSVAGLPSEERHNHLTEGFRSAFRSCHCLGIDVDGIENALVLSVDSPERNHRILPLSREAINGATDVNALARALAAP